MGTQLAQPQGTLPAAGDENAELQLARAGDLMAYRQLVLRHQALVFGSALRLTGQRADALELAQEVFLRLHAALARIANPAHLMRWLMRVLSQWPPATEAAHDAVAMDPGPEFATRVIAHVELRWSHRRRAAFAEGRTGGRSRIPFILPFALAVVAIAGVVLWLLWSGALRRPVVADVTATQSAAEIPTAAQGRLPPAAAGVVRAVPAAAAVSVTSALRDPYRRYTVLALPLRHDSQDPDARASLESFYTALLIELRAVPGIVVLIPGITAPPTDADRPADYLLTITSLDAAPTAGGQGFRVTDGWGDGASASRGLPSAGIVTLQGGEARPTRTGSARSEPQWPVEVKVQPIGQPDAGGFTSVLQIGNDDAQLAATQVELLRLKVFPDLLTKQQLLARIRDGSLPGSERSAALSDLLGTQLRSGSEALESTDISAILEQSMAMRADQRAQLWRSLRRIPHPELVEPLLDSLRRDADESVRYEAVATLAANYANEPRVRTAIESVARQDSEQIVRMAARRALHGEAEWHAFVIATLKDKRLTYVERLEPLLVAARSAATPAEMQDVRNVVSDEQVLNPLVNLVRDGWFDAAGTDSISDAINLLANVENPAAFDLFVQVLRQDAPRPETPAIVVKPAPQVSPEGMAWLLNHRNDPRARRILQDIADGKVDAQLVATVEQMRKFEPPRLPPQIRQQIPRRP